MKSSSCSIKLLDKAHVGLRVRMTSDKSTLPFDNVPMKNVKITNYNDQGFCITHPNLPKETWVDFNQLPLLNLTIKNGIIEDEITFVENIIIHKMELIKTNCLDYIELLDIKKREENKTFVTLNDIKPGDVVSSALCENGANMIYLGSWFTKNLEEQNYGYSYHNNKNKKYFLTKLSPQRAFFLMEINEPKETLKEILDAKHQSGFNVEDYYNLSYEKSKNVEELRKNYYNIIAEKLKNDSSKRYKLVNYAVSSKFIKNLTSKNTNIQKLKDKDFNKNLIINYLHNPTNEGYDIYKNFCYRNKNFMQEWIKIFDDLKIKNESFYRNDVYYMQDTRENISENARIFIENMKNITIEKEEI